MRAPASGCVGGVLLADRHQAGHLVLGEGDLLAAEGGQGKVGDLEVLAGGDSRHDELLLVVGVEGGYVLGSARRADTPTCPDGTRHVPCPQRSPSEALSPSVGPRERDRPTAISSDVCARHESTPLARASGWLTCEQGPT